MSVKIPENKENNNKEESAIVQKYGYSKWDRGMPKNYLEQK